MIKILRCAPMLFCVLLLVSCTDPQIERTRALTASIKEADGKIDRLMEKRQLKEIYTLLAAKREAIDTLVINDFNGDRCVLHDGTEDGACPFHGAHYRGKLDSSVKSMLVDANKWHQNKSIRMRLAASKAIHDEDFLWPRPAIARFLINDAQNSSWQDVVMFKFFVQGGSDIFCEEAENLISNEFKRNAILEKWRTELLKYDPISEAKTLFRTHWFITFGEYDGNKEAFANEGRIWQKDPGPWSNQGVFVRGNPLAAKIEFSSFCSPSLPDIMSRDIAPCLAPLPNRLEIRWQSRTESF